MLTSALPPLFVAAAIGSWNGVVIANPATHTCQRVKLPGSTHEQVVLAGNKVAFQTGKYTFKYGRVGGRVFREVRSSQPISALTADGSTFAYVAGGQIHVFEQRTITPKLPHGAQVNDLAFHGPNVAVGATWGNGQAGTLKGGLFVISGGVTRLVEREPTPYDETPSPVWSPGGTRIAIIKGGDVWTIAPDGSDPIQISHTPKASERGVIWSPDSTELAYSSRRSGVVETYVAHAGGGGDMRLTHTKPQLDRPTGTQPVAWFRNQIAVTSYNSIGIVNAGGGPLTRVCTFTPAASTYLGPVTWGP